MAGHLGTIWASVALDTAPLGAGAARARREMYALDATINQSAKKSTAAAGGLGKALLGVGRAAVVMGGIAGAAAYKMASEFDSAMHKAWSVTEDNKAAMQGWSKEVIALSTRFPESAKDMADALYWIKSDMPDATDAEQFATLETAAKGATAGVAELRDTTEALVVVQNAYAGSGVELKSPIDYMDAMNMAVKRGSVTLQDFVANMGKATGTAAMAKVPFTEITAAVSTLTRKGVPVETAFMALNQTMMTFLKPSKEASDLAQQLGLDFTLTGLRSKGLAGSLMEIAEKVPDEQLAELFPNIRALKAVLPLAGVSVADFAKDLEEMGRMSGSSNSMFKKNMDSMENKAKVWFNRIRKPIIEWGTSLFPTVEKLGNAVARVFEGKNAVANAFFGGLKSGVSVLTSLTKAAWDFKGVFLAVGAAFAAFKIGSWVHGLASAGGIVSNVIAGLKGNLAGVTGFSGKVAQAFRYMHTSGLSAAYTMTGLTGTLGAFGIAAAAGAVAGLSIAAAIKRWDESEQKAWDSVLAMDRAMGDQAASALPLVSKIESLRKTKADLAAQGKDNASVTQELTNAQNQLASVMPTLIDHWDGMGNAIAGTNAAMQDTLQYYSAMAGIQLETKTSAEQLAETQIGTWERSKVDADAMSGVLDSINSKMKDAAGSSYAAQRTFQAIFGLAAQDAKAAKQAYLDYVRSAGSDIDKSQLEGVEKAFDALILKQTLAGGSILDLKNKYAQASGEMATTFGQLGRASGETGTAFGTGIGQWITQLTSKEPEVRAAASRLVLAYTAEWMRGRGVAEVAVQQFINGITPILAMPGIQRLGADAILTWGANMVAAGQKTPAEMLAIVTQLNAAAGSIDLSKGTDAAKQQLSGMLQSMGVAAEEANRQADLIVNSMVKIAEATTRPGSDKKKISITTEVVGNKEATAKLRTIEDAANKAAKNKKLTVEAATLAARMNIQLLQTKINGLKDKTIRISTEITEHKVNPTFATIDAAVDYLFNTYQSKLSGRGALNLGVQVGGAAKSVDALTTAWDNLSKTAIVGWSRDVDNVKFGEIEQAIQNLAPDGVALGAWRNMRKEYDNTKAALEAYSTAMDASQVKQEALSHQQELLQRQLTTYQERLQAVASGTDAWRDSLGKWRLSLQTLSQIKITGQTAREDLSFNEQQQLNRLELERLQIQQRLRAGAGTDADYQRLFDINKAKSDLELQKQIDDLATSTKYDPLEKSISDALDPLRGVERTQAQILSDIKAGQAETARVNALVKQNEAAQDRITAAMNAEKDKAREMRLEYDAMSKSMQNLETVLSGMMANFEKHFQDMKTAAEAAQRAAEAANSQGGAPPQYALGGPVTQTGLIYAHAGEYVLSRSAVRAFTKLPMLRFSAMPTASTSVSESSMQIYNFDKLVLPGVTDGAGLMDDLRKLRTRQALP